MFFGGAAAGFIRSNVPKNYIPAVIKSSRFSLATEMPFTAAEDCQEMASQSSSPPEYLLRPMSNASEAEVAAAAATYIAQTSVVWLVDSGG